MPISISRRLDGRAPSPGVPENFRTPHQRSADVNAARRYEALIETPDRHPVLACLLNLTTAMTAIDLPNGKVLNYFQRLIWDDTTNQDRFYAWADKELLQETIQAAQQGTFARELGFQFFHKNATDSYKQVQFGEANVQLYVSRRRPASPGLAQHDQDGARHRPLKDIGAHALLEVLPNALEKLVGQTGLTDPKAVYVLRWIAGRHVGVPACCSPNLLAN